MTIGPSDIPNGLLNTLVGVTFPMQCIHIEIDAIAVLD